MDTIILIFYGPGKFGIKHLEWYVPELVQRKFRDLSANERQSKKPYLKKFVFTPLQEDRYRPRVEIFEALTDDKKDMRYVMKVEFSAPKLLYGNSIQEVKESDKDLVFRRLRSALLDAGILIELPVIAQATVRAIHFCKNIILPADIQMREVIHELLRVDLSKVIDVSEVRFKKGGRSLNLYSGVIERSIYEKVADSMRPKNKRSDKARINRERAYVEKHNLQDKEIFRYEYRIKKTNTVKRELNPVLGRDKGERVKFEDLFTAGLYQKVINKSWRDVVGKPGNQLALLGPINKLTLLTHFLSWAAKERKPHGINKALILNGLASVIIDHGLKEVKGVISGFLNKDHTERLSKKIEASAAMTKGLPYSNCIAFITGALEKLKGGIMP